MVKEKKKAFNRVSDKGYVSNLIRRFPNLKEQMVDTDISRAERIFRFFAVQWHCK